MKAWHQCVCFLAALTFLLTANLAVGATCPPSSKLEPESRDCLPIVDVSAQINPFATSLWPPDLAAVRLQYHHDTVIRLPMLNPADHNKPVTGMPRPGGIGTGIEYRLGALQALESSILYTTMTIQPNGLNPSTDGLQWLYTTSSNRMQYGVETVGLYQGAANTGSLGVYDWSCSATSPCGNNTSPAWVLILDFSTLSCNITRQIDEGDFVDQVIRYENETVQTAGGDTPTWHNAVYLRNWCHGGWDLLYQHDYTAAQHDCSSDSSCAWWGPIFETFASTSGAPFPAINTLGFDSTTLVHDGITATFTDTEPDAPADTTFTYPDSAWTLYSLTPQRAYHVGNYPTELVVADCASGGWRQFKFASMKACQNFVNSN